MISAMPAVALRREKKRSKPGLARASSAASFGGQAKDVASQGDANRAPSVSTLDIPQRIVRYEYRPDTAPTAMHTVHTHNRIQHNE